MHYDYYWVLSPSSREAWIEITPREEEQMKALCRLPHGRRGLKLSVTVRSNFVSLSPSSREAWIEMQDSNGK